MAIDTTWAKMTDLVNRRSVLMTGACLSLSACDKFGTDTARWVEEIDCTTGE